MENNYLKGTVIIVEDDMLLAIVEERIVEKIGFKVVAKASSGEDAIKKIKEHQPDVVLMDVSINGDIDGIEAVSRIRSFSTVPVIYISGNSDNKHLVRAKKTGFVDYLVKPITHSDMVLPLEKSMKKGSHYSQTIHPESYKKPEHYTDTANGRQC